MYYIEHIWRVLLFCTFVIRVRKNCIKMAKNKNKSFSKK